MTADNTVVANCVNCGAPTTLSPSAGVMMCFHCGSAEQRPDTMEHIDVGAASDKDCPSCTASLSRATLDGVPLLVCQSCCGMLIQMEHFVSVVEAARAHEKPSEAIPPRRQSPGERTITCPSCKQSMLSHFYGGPGNLVIDTCERCHLNWLDPGELRRIARAS